MSVMLRAACLAGATLFAAGEADAHGFAGPRFFPATLATDDPFVADEFSLPTVASARDQDGTRVTAYATDLAKRVTPDFGVEFGAAWLHMRPPGGPAVDGWDNVSLGAKYQLDVDPVRELILSVGIDADIGGTGAKRIGAESFSTLTPAIFFGKGFGDIADRTGWLRAFALTGTAGVAFPTRSAESKALQLGFALEYSLIYLQSQVKDIGLPAPFDRMIPLVELALETPLDHGGATTGSINPGVLWAGQYFQLGAEAILPLNRASGRGTGFIAQLHFFIDDLFPASLGRPLLGG